MLFLSHSDSRKREKVRELHISIDPTCVQNLRFVIYDIDDDSGELNSQDPLGTAECRLGQVATFINRYQPLPTFAHLCQP